MRKGDLNIQDLIFLSARGRGRLRLLKEIREGLVRQIPRCTRQRAAREATKGGKPWKTTPPNGI